MKKFFIFVALCAVALCNGVQGSPSVSKRQAHNYPPFRGPYGPVDFPSPDRYMDYGPSSDYFKQDMIQRGVASIFDKSYLCVASCVKPLVEDLKRIVLGPVIRELDVKSRISNYADILCGPRDTIDQCNEKCPNGSAKTGVMTFFPLYESICSEWNGIKNDLDCVISSDKSAIEYIHNCTRENTRMIGMRTAFGQMNSISDFMLAVRNYPEVSWKLSQCYIDGFRQSITGCKKETIDAVRRFSQQADRTRCDILDHFGVPKKEAPETCVRNS